MRLILLALLAGISTTITTAGAQTYPTPRPVPATTSVPALHDAAVEREIVERFHLGLAALDRRDWQSSAAEFTAILKLDPREPQGSTAAYDLALADAQLGRNDDAARALHLALTRDPAFLAAMANLVAIDLRLGDLRDARAVADRFVSLAPDSARALYSRGIVALRGNDLATARDDFSKLLKNDPKYAVAHYDLGLTEAHLQSYVAAEREFSAALALAPGYARARFALGTVLLHEGSRAAAREAFDRAAQDATDDPSLRGLATEMRDAIAVTH